jgi:hypothetical protein
VDIYVCVCINKSPVVLRPKKIKKNYTPCDKDLKIGEKIFSMDLVLTKILSPFFKIICSNINLLPKV